jgi:hypothetical protein
MANSALSTPAGRLALASSQERKVSTDRKRVEI